MVKLISKPSSQNEVCKAKRNGNHQTSNHSGTARFPPETHVARGARGAQGGFEAKGSDSTVEGCRVLAGIIRKCGNDKKACERCVCNDLSQRRDEKNTRPRLQALSVDIEKNERHACRRFQRMAGDRGGPKGIEAASVLGERGGWGVTGGQSPQRVRYCII